jgi:hypothetical protein
MAPGWGWGVMRDDLRKHEVLWAPVPLNILFRHTERFYWKVAYPRGQGRVKCPCCGQFYQRFRHADPYYKTLIERLKHYEEKVEQREVEDAIARKHEREGTS